jgi:hypothetical protein
MEIVAFPADPDAIFEGLVTPAERLGRLASEAFAIYGRAAGAVTRMLATATTGP